MADAVALILVLPASSTTTTSRDFQWYRVVERHSGEGNSCTFPPSVELWAALLQREEQRRGQRKTEELRQPEEGRGGRGAQEIGRREEGEEEERRKEGVRRLCACSRRIGVCRQQRQRRKKELRREGGGGAQDIPCI
eukprot:555926-Rhodomonas_salina.2